MYAYPLVGLVAIVLAVYFVRVSSPEPGGRWERVMRRARWWLGIVPVIALFACSSAGPESSGGSTSGTADAGCVPAHEWEVCGACGTTAPDGCGGTYACACTSCTNAAGCPASMLDGTACAFLVCTSGVCGIAPEPAGDGCLSNACGPIAVGGTCDGTVARCDATCPDAGAMCTNVHDCDPALLNGTMCMGLACDPTGKMTDPRSKVPGCYIEPVNLLTPCPMPNGCTGFCEGPDGGNAMPFSCVLPTGSTCADGGL